MSVKVREAAFASIGRFAHFSALGQLTDLKSNLRAIRSNGPRLDRFPPAPTPPNCEMERESFPSSCRAMTELSIAYLIRGQNSCLPEPKYRLSSLSAEEIRYVTAFCVTYCPSMFANRCPYGPHPCFDSS